MSPPPHRFTNAVNRNYNAPKNMGEVAVSKCTTSTCKFCQHAPTAIRKKPHQTTNHQGKSERFPLACVHHVQLQRWPVNTSLFANVQTQAFVNVQGTTKIIFQSTWPTMVIRALQTPFPIYMASVGSQDLDVLNTRRKRVPYKPASYQRRSNALYFVVMSSTSPHQCYTVRTTDQPAQKILFLHMIMSSTPTNLQLVY